MQKRAVYSAPNERARVWKVFQECVKVYNSRTVCSCKCDLVYNSTTMCKRVLEHSRLWKGVQELAKAHNSVRECAKAVCKCVKSVTRRIMAPPFATPPTPHASLTPLPSFKWSPPPPLKAENKRRMVTTATIKIIFKGPKMGGKAHFPKCFSNDDQNLQKWRPLSDNKKFPFKDKKERRWSFSKPFSHFFIPLLI